jgi:outer membrane receptor protein involved in Fe transport
MICGASVLASGQALAQDQSAQVEEFVVTGSRIPQPNLTSTSPITVIGDAEAKLQGTTNVETLINNLPQAFADFGNSASNGASGTATVDLRGLGPQRTLVLVDGKRLMPADPKLPVADLNTIPAALVDHVEVVTGGASAVYGSDALAGVVNFVMKKDFEGVRIDAQYGFAQHNQHNDAVQALENAPGSPAGVPDDFSGGGTWDLTAIVGVNSPDGKGNATVYAGYRHLDAVTQDKYDYTNCSIATGGALNDIHKCFGSSNYNRFISLDTGNQFFAETNRTFTPWNNQVFNFGPDNYLQRPDERYTLGGFAHYEINLMFDVYTDVMFSDDHTLAQIAASGIFIGSGPNAGIQNINCDNPLMSAQQAAALGCGTVLGATDDTHLEIGRRNIEGGPRIDDLRHTAYRIDLGTKGDLGHGWSYDIYGQYGLTLFSENYSNEFSKQRVANALEVVTDTRAGSPTLGQPICKVTLSGQDPSCVPLDVFGGLGAFTPDMLNYVAAQGFQTGYTEEQVVSGSLTGDLGQYGFKSPMATDGVGIALGAEYRREALKLDTSRDFQINDLYGQGGATLPVPLSSFDVKEFYGEIRVPLVQDAPFAKLLQFEGGYRHSDYSSVGGTDAFKLAGDWEPIPDVRFRASYQRAVRAPTVLESFAPSNNVLFPFQDPCSSNGGRGPSFTLAQCQNTGLSAAQYGSPLLDCPASQCKHVVSGNANLSPETSVTKSFGVVFTPSFFRGFNASVDYFDIKVDDFINAYGAGNILTLCANNGPGFFCDLVKRDPNGTIFSDASSINDITRNTGFKATKGLDVEVNYKTSFSDLGIGDYGGLSFNFVGTYIDKLLTEQIPTGLPGGGTASDLDCNGYFGVICGTPTPKWRHKLRATWTTPWGLALSVNWRYLAGAKLDINACANETAATCTGNAANLSTLGAGVNNRIDAKIKAYNYFDLAGTWTVRDGTTLRFGVNNVFDKDPPIVDTNNFGVSAPPFGNGNTYPGVYDSLGRTFFVGITADF